MKSNTKLLMRALKGRTQELAGRPFGQSRATVAKQMRHQNKTFGKAIHRTIIKSHWGFGGGNNSGHSQNSQHPHA